MNGPSKRQMQVEAWMVAFTITAAAWCFAGGVYLGLKVLWALARMALGL